MNEEIPWKVACCLVAMLRHENCKQKEKTFSAQLPFDSALLPGISSWDLVSADVALFEFLQTSNSSFAVGFFACNQKRVKMKRVFLGLILVIFITFVQSQEMQDLYCGDRNCYEGEICSKFIFCHSRFWAFSC